MSAVRLRRLTRHFGDVVAVDRVDLDAAAGESLSIVGPRGSGRHTLLLLIATLVRPSSGELELSGVDAADDPLAARSHVAYVGAQPMAGAGLTVREYLRWMAGSRRGGRCRRPDAVDDALRRLMLAGDADVDTLPRAQRQRLALGVMLITRPSIVVLDDPLADADDATRACAAEWITELRGEGSTVIHGAAVEPPALEAPASLLRMDSGRLRQVRPANAAIAGVL
jgi:ABC-2 type transport system ATP-binding protein